MSRLKIIFILVLLLIFCQSTYSQCSVIPVSLDERVSEADLVLEGKVLKTYAVWTSNRSGIYTISEIEIYKIFKGEIPGEKINLLTEGGQIEDVRIVVEPELEIEPGMTGIFFLKNFKGGAEISGNNFEPVAASQGMIRYSDNENNASGIFEKYYSITEELYPAIEKRTNVRKEIKAFNPAKFKKNAGSPVPLAAPDITNINPSTTTAGTFSIVTITGSNFGASYVSGTSKLEFKDANTGGSAYLTTPDNHIISWTDNQIQAYVPIRAGSGTIRVTNSTSEITTSASSITIEYNQSNPSSSGVYYEPHLIRDDGVSGYLFSYSTSTTDNGVSFNGHTNAKARFESALETWRCNTGFNVDVTATTNTTSSATSDGINAVLFDNDANALPSGVLGRATSRYGICGSEAVLTEIDVVFKRDGTNGVTWYFDEDPGAIPFSSFDFESVALHELGHGHQLGHIISPGAVMHYSITNSQVSRTLNSTNDIAGGNYVMSHSSGFNNCGLQGMTAHSCALPVVLSDFSGYTHHSTATLNWVTEEEDLDHFELERSEDGIHFEEIQIITTTGKKSNSYSINDYIPGKSFVYYRLKMVEHDASYSYSKIISLTLQDNFLTVYPNPSSVSVQELFIGTSTPSNDIVSMYIADALGKTVPAIFSSDKDVVKIQKPQTPGIYHLILLTKTKKHTTSFLVE